MERKIRTALILLSSISTLIIIISYSSRPGPQLDIFLNTRNNIDKAIQSVGGSSKISDSECGCRQLDNIPVHETSTCGLLSTIKGNNQKIISFSFYLKNDKVRDETELCSLSTTKNGYLKGIRKNLEKIREYYPGYSMRLYHDAPLGNTKCPIRDELCSLFCQPDQVLDLCSVKNIEMYPNLESAFGMMWRFAPMADKYVLEWHSRDLDAVMLEREVAAVHEWKESGTTFHAMRDHPYHNIDILGGMFGILQATPQSKAERKLEFEKMISTFGSSWVKGGDQVALRKVLAPVAGKDSMVHDSYNCQSSLMKGSIPAPWPTQRLSGPNFTLPSTPNFVGNTEFAINIECPKKCRPKDHQEWKLC